MPELNALVRHDRMLERLGAAGTGEVHRAAAVRLGRMVALTFLHPSIRHDREHRTRLLRKTARRRARSHRTSPPWAISATGHVDFETRY